MGRLCRRSRDRSWLRLELMAGAFGRGPFAPRRRRLRRRVQGEWRGELRSGARRTASARIMLDGPRRCRLRLSTKSRNFCRASSRSVIRSSSRPGLRLHRHLQLAGVMRSPFARNAVKCTCGGLLLFGYEPGRIVSNVKRRPCPSSPTPQPPRGAARSHGDRRGLRGRCDTRRRWHRRREAIDVRPLAPRP